DEERAMAATTGVTARHAIQLEPAFVEQVVRRYVEAWDALDGDAMAALCTEDVVWDEPFLPRNARGREEVRAYIKAVRESMRDFHLEPLTEPYISATEPTVLLPTRITGTLTGTWSYTGLRGTGRR